MKKNLVKLIFKVPAKKETLNNICKVIKLQKFNRITFPEIFFNKKQFDSFLFEWN